mmetsp:Transcript_20147/g.62210  ORF Transcript_20147/g.62210 Transcript_20147/m.62210 type:complete len:145 (-) Transcript_20147:69-503(-)
MPDRAPWRTTTVTDVTSLPPSSPLVSGAEQYSLARLGIASGGGALLLSVAKRTSKNQRAMATPLILTTLHSWCVAAILGARMMRAARWREALVFAQAFWSLNSSCGRPQRNAYVESAAGCALRPVFGAIRVGAEAAAALASTNA